MYLVKSKIKAFYHEKGKKVNSGAFEALNRIVERYLACSVVNAKGFKTIKEEDMWLSPGIFNKQKGEEKHG